MTKTKREKLKRLIVAAHSSELLPLIDLGRKHFEIKNGVAYLAAGIGPVAATFGLTHFLEDFQPERISAIGTAGIINTDLLKIGDLVSASAVGTASGLKAVYTPKPQPQRYNLNAKSGWKKAKIYAPQEITRNPEHIKTLKKKFDVEHLESFAFAFVAKRFRTPLDILLGLTNVIDENAHKDWFNNQERLIKKLCKRV